MTCIGGLLDKMTGSVLLTAGEVKEVEGHIDQLQAENDKLREEIEQWHRLTAGIELPEYPITEFKPKDLEREHICASCRFFDPYYTDDDPPPHCGTCHRYPPVFVGDSCDVEMLVSMDAWSLPYVGAYATCGEWEADE